MSIIIPANSAVSGGFTAANSLMFASGDSAYLSRTQSNGTSARKFTASIWFKRCPVTNVGNQPIWSSSSSTGDALDLLLQGNGEIVFEDVNGNAPKFVTTRRLRDPSAWYHVVVAVDSTQGTSTNRVKIYINGVQETAFGTANYPSENMDFAISTSADTMKFGSGGQYASNYFDGYMAEVVFIDGTQNVPTDFGEFEEDSGIWQPIDVSGLTLGANGCYLDFEDDSALGNDAAGSNNFSLNNIAATDQATDTCTNNFATLNPLVAWGGATVTADSVLKSGNTFFHTSSDAEKCVATSSIGVSSGKWYCEIKIPQIERTWVGILNRQFFTSTTNNWWTTGLSSGFFWYGNGPAVYNANNQTSSAYGGYANNDVVMFALDMDNYAWYLGKNGTWLNSGNPESGATKTGSVTGLSNFGTATLTDYGEVFFMQGDSSNAGTSNAQWNFGNPFFSISSGNSDGNGYGNFEYTVPSGYFALNSKNLAEYGG